MKKNILFRLILLAVLSIPLSLQAQVTVGSDIPATRGALLELKTKQTTGTVPSVSDDGNITSDDGDGGFLLPKVKLVDPETLEPFIAVDDPEFVNNTNSLKERLAGLMVYNLSSISGLLPGICVWDGSKWNTTQPPISISVQPEKFTFYETLVSGAIDPLSVSVNGGVAPITYQWYQVTGSNVHVRIGSPVTQGTGPKTPTYTPTHVKIGDGDTRVASRAGIFRFYCVVTDAAGQQVESDIAEVAVGCGAKNNAGEWISFMCFNLGATVHTIDEQKNYAMAFSPVNDPDGKHYYIAGEENVYGDLYQWGRIGDGHEKRGAAQGFTPGGQTSGNQVAHGATGPTFENGNILGTSSQTYPWYQVARADTDFYGKFITTGSAQNYNWAYNLAASSIDQLWRTGRFGPNDPCAKINADGLTYMTYYPEASTSTAGGSSTTAWRTPSQHEWGEIYKSGTISGSPGVATANTWTWYSSNGCGYEIKPDGVTTTLFLPASGYRNFGNGLLYYQGAHGGYWSISVLSTIAYRLSFGSGSVNPAYSDHRGYGFALRCIKNS